MDPTSQEGTEALTPGAGQVDVDAALGETVLYCLSVREKKSTVGDTVIQGKENCLIKGLNKAQDGPSPTVFLWGEGKKIDQISSNRIYT